jgi:hypothetical protein
MGPVGTRCVATGICIAEITTITSTTAGHDGSGAATVALVCIDIGCVPCTGIIRDTGVESGRTGTCGVEITITGVLAGSGAVTDALDAICTA